RRGRRRAPRPSRPDPAGRLPREPADRAGRARLRPRAHAAAAAPRRPHRPHPRRAGPAGRRDAAHRHRDRGRRRDRLGARGERMARLAQRRRPRRRAPERRLRRHTGPDRRAAAAVSTTGNRGRRPPRTRPARPRSDPPPRPVDERHAEPVAPPPPPVGRWGRDILGDDFQARTFPQPDDDEAAVVTTLVRYRPGGRPLPRRPRLAVVYVHGFADYFIQTELARFWADRGAVFYAVDLRKSGRSIRPHQ